jgi:diadenosine tetraphosphatase ApaH/serine/threonine PP2A family protein phosphatase
MNMRIAILSDIHGNLEALNTAMDYIVDNDIDKVYCLGDIVGYGPNPNECVETIAEKCEKVVIGNHDHAVLGLTSTEYFNDFAKLSTYWTKNILTEENKEFLSSLEFTYSIDDILFVHATPSDPPMWHYILSEIDARHELSHFNEKICFIGHSHFPIVFYQDGFSRKSKLVLNADQRYIVNVGSIGQPRDGNPKTCFCVYNDDTKEIEYIRLNYDLEKTREKIVRAGLPVFLADRLIKGY